MSLEYLLWLLCVTPTRRWSGWRGCWLLVLLHLRRLGVVLVRVRLSLSIPSSLHGAMRRLLRMHILRWLVCPNLYRRTLHRHRHLLPHFLRLYRPRVQLLMA